MIMSCTQCRNVHCNQPFHPMKDLKHDTKPISRTSSKVRRSTRKSYKHHGVTASLVGGGCSRFLNGVIHGIGHAVRILLGYDGIQHLGYREGPPGQAHAISLSVAEEQHIRRLLIWQAAVIEGSHGLVERPRDPLSHFVLYLLLRSVAPHYPEHAPSGPYIAETTQRHQVMQGNRSQLVVPRGPADPRERPEERLDIGGADLLELG
jgi:hypothetical protein